MPGGRPASLSFAGQEDPDGFVGESGRTGDVDEHGPGRRGDPGLLQQFALCGDQRRFVGDVHQAGGQLPQPAAERVSVLLHQDHPVVVVQGDDRDGPVVLDHLTGGHGALRHPHPVDPHRGHLAVEHPPGVDHRERFAHLAPVSASDGEASSGSPSMGSRSDSR